MRLKYRFIIPLYLAVFLLQTTVLPQLEFLYCTPNLLLCLTVLITFWEDGSMGMILGIAAGLLLDVCFGQLIGIASLCYFCITLGIMLTKHLMYRNSMLSVLFIGALSSAIYPSLYWGISVIMGSSYHFFYMAKTLPFLLLYNSIVVLIVNLFFQKRMRRYPEDRYMY